MKPLQNRFIFLSIFLIISTSCCEDDLPDIPIFGNLEGTIIDCDTQEPIQGVTVSMGSGISPSITGTDGRFSFIDVEPRNFTLQVQANGFQSDTKDIEIVRGISSKIDICMQSIPPEIEVNRTIINFDKNSVQEVLEIRNLGGSKLIWEVVENLGWLSVFPRNGEATNGNPSTVVFAVDRSELENEGTTTQNIAIISNSRSPTISISVIK